MDKVNRGKGSEVEKDGGRQEGKIGGSKVDNE